jgi:hypothetical protein
MNWDIEIEKVSNGYVCKWWADGADDEMIKNQLVFEEQDGERGELDAFVSLVHFLAEHFSVSGSKHDKYRLRCDVIDQMGVEDADAIH